MVPHHALQAREDPEEEEEEEAPAQSPERGDLQEASMRSSPPPECPPDQLSLRGSPARSLAPSQISVRGSPLQQRGSPSREEGGGFAADVDLQESPCAQEMESERIREASPGSQQPSVVDPSPARRSLGASLMLISTPARSIASRSQAPPMPSPMVAPVDDYHVTMGGQAPLAPPVYIPPVVVPAVPAVSPAMRGTLNELRATRRHPEAAVSSTADIPREWTKFGCEVCLMCPYICLLIPFALLYHLVCLPVCMWVCCRTGKDTEQQDDGRRTLRSSHNPRYMQQRPAGVSEPSVPAHLQGVYYLRPNSRDQVLVCFEGAAWDTERRELRLPWHLPRSAAFQRTFLARAILATGRLFNARSVYSFSGDLEAGERCRGLVRTQVCGRELPKIISSVAMMDVSSAKDGSLWRLRRTTLGYRSPPYWAERVLDASGAETSYHEHLRREAPSKCIFL